MFADVDGLFQTTLHTSWLAELVMEVLILGSTLGEVDNNISAPAEETVMVSTAPSSQHGMSGKEVLLPMEEFLHHLHQPRVVGL